MLERFRAHVRAQFVGYVALFVALGGTAAAAGYVVSRNAQIGPGTVSGSHPPGGKHDNIVNGSINATDIQPESIGGARVIEGSLARVPSASEALNARQIGGHDPPTSFKRTLGPDEGLELLIYNTEDFSAYAKCNSNANTFTIRFTDYSNSKDRASLNWFYGNGSTVKASGALFEQGPSLRTLEITEPRIEGQFIYRSYADPSRGYKDNVAVIAFHGLASPGPNGFCELHGAVIGAKGPFD